MHTESWQHAFVLHSRPYRETSLFLDLLTEHQGHLRVLAKGARSKRSILKSIMQPFTPIMVCWKEYREINILCKAESISLGLPLNGVMLYSGLYINELVSRVLTYESDCTLLFYEYFQCLQWLSSESDSPEPALRRFELSLLSYLGYGVDFLHCAISGEPIKDAMTYLYEEEKGFISSFTKTKFSFSGRELRALAKREFSDINLLHAAKRFTRIALKPYLGSKPLKSRELFHQFL